jgi:hypothetical protein
VAELPNRNAAFIQPSKIQNYLLNPEHPIGGSKADYFMSFGFSPEQWEVLRVALLEHARTAEIIEIRQKKHGIAYAVRGKLTTPDDRNPVILSVWQIDESQDAPRFITAYPDD